MDFFEDVFGVGDLVSEAGGVAGVERLGGKRDAAAELGGVGAVGVDDGEAGGEVADAAGVFGEAGEGDVGVGENVEVVERGGGGVDEDVGAVAAGEGGEAVAMEAAATLGSVIVYLNEQVLS